MIYTFIDQILEHYSIDLEILRRDTNLYSISMLQNKGIFHFDDNFFGNQDSQVESVKFNSFLSIAKANNSSLVITPEYSCPWASVRHILDDANRLPSTNKLWVLGCESITPAEVAGFQENYNGINNIEVIYNDDIDNAPGGVLLDPCVYIFKANNSDGQERLIVLIQFKTQHMGVWNDNLEQQKMIPGEHLYILRNSEDSINLATVICSDAMVFNGAEIFPNAAGFWDTRPFIILSIQMNPQPSHSVFRNFRRNILERSNKDVISLNWSSEGSASGFPNFFTQYCKSNISITTEHIVNDSYIEEKRIDDNHKKGLYYVYTKPSRHNFYFTPEVEFFYLRLRKPSVGLTPLPANRRRGPELEEIYTYDQELETFVPSSNTSDGFQDFIDSIQIQSSNLKSEDVNILDKERLIALTTGELSKLKPGSNWHTVNRLKSFLLEDSESIKRYTVTFDVEGKDYRTSQIGKVEDLNLNVLKRPDLFPDIIASFKNNCTEVMFLNKNGMNYKYNLVSNDNQIATVAFIGHKSKADAQQILHNLTKLFPAEDLGNKRIVVWYKPNMIANNYANEATDVPKYTSAEKTNLTSITKE
ncbi:hypothetical protein K8089_04450 [Aequorivita sp. F47161]|uniref:Uncharacterized protein n=1 Tax=Aequorivita vitellina TaxID=2874475 RepID=A0A9X1U273_9FLAO|nr:hypothetical protein [Aequorivita vitellina]MCG2418263.1 hypothetical protein [Aequorivita vitellina]